MAAIIFCSSCGTIGLLFEGKALNELFSRGDQVKELSRYKEFLHELFYTIKNVTLSCTLFSLKFQFSAF